VLLFRTYVLERDLSKHTQLVSARSARQFRNWLGDLYWVFNMFVVAKVVGLVRDFKCFVWQMSRASPFALRRQEFVRHAVAGRPCVALVRASLWLLHEDDFLSEAVVCAVFFSV
jgi:hypothetical protein